MNVPLLGGGFGRKSKWDYVLEAALVSKATGLPIKVVWTREETTSRLCRATRVAGLRRP